MKIYIVPLKTTSQHRIYKTDSILKVLILYSKYNTLKYEKVQNLYTNLKYPQNSAMNHKNAKIITEKRRCTAKSIDKASKKLKPDLEIFFASSHYQIKNQSTCTVSRKSLPFICSVDDKFG